MYFFLNFAIFHFQMPIEQTLDRTLFGCLKIYCNKVHPYIFHLTMFEYIHYLIIDYFHINPRVGEKKLPRLKRPLKKSF